MACDQTILELISCYVDGEATPQEAARAEAHLDTCPECREMVKEWRHGIEMLDWTYSKALPENTAEIAFEPPAPKPEVERKRWSFPLPDMRIPAAAAAVFLVALLGVTAYYHMAALPVLGKGLTTAGKAQTVLVAKGIRLTVQPDTEISRLGEKSIRLVQGTIGAEVTHGLGFKVLTRKFEIIDQGTKFEVHSDSKTDRVTVTEGEVLVLRGESNRYQVGPGGTLVSTGEGSSIETRLIQDESARAQTTQHGGVRALVILPALIVAALGLFFWLKMLINALTRDFKDGGTKVAWVLIIFLMQFLGAVIYYYAVYVKDHPQKKLQFPLVGRRGDKRVVFPGNVAAILLLFCIPAAIIVKKSTSHLNLPIFLGAAVVTWMIIAASIQSSLKAPIEKVYDLDQPFNPGTRFWYLLVGRKGNKRVIQWPNVVAAWVLASVAIQAGFFWMSRVVGAPLVVAGKAVMLIGPVAGALFIAACLVQILSYPLDVLTDIETGERPSQEVRKRRYPLPLLVGRWQNTRVMMWANMAVLAVFGTIAYSLYVSSFSESVSTGTLLHNAGRLFFGLFVLLAIYATSVPLKKPARLDDDDYDSTAPLRATALTIAVCKDHERVVRWWNALLLLAGWILLYSAIGLLLPLLDSGKWEPATWKLWTLLGVLAGLFELVKKAFLTPLDKLPRLDDVISHQKASSSGSGSLATRRCGRGVVLWLKDIGMLVLFLAASYVSFAFIFADTARLWKWKTDPIVVYALTFACAMVLVQRKEVADFGIDDRKLPANILIVRSNGRRTILLWRAAKRMLVAPWFTGVALSALSANYRPVEHLSHVVLFVAGVVIALIPGIVHIVYSLFIPLTKLAGLDEDLPRE